MNIEKFNDEVLYAKDEIIHLDSQSIAELQEKAKKNTRQRIRLCTHKNVEDNLHEMFIVHTQGTYVRPHKHCGKIESFSVIKGEADVVIFDEDGNILKIVGMGDYQSGKHFYQRIETALYHTLIILSETFVFHEMTNGPFIKEQTQYASWSPEESNAAGVQRFSEDLTHRVSKMV